MKESPPKYHQRTRHVAEQPSQRRNQYGTYVYAHTYVNLHASVCADNGMCAVGLCPLWAISAPRRAGLAAEHGSELSRRDRVACSWGGDAQTSQHATGLLGGGDDSSLAAPDTQ